MVRSALVRPLLIIVTQNGSLKQAKAEYAKLQSLYFSFCNTLHIYEGCHQLSFSQAIGFAAELGLPIIGIEIALRGHYRA